MQTIRSNNTPFWVFLIGIVLILLSNSLLTEGMFLDGVTYACISRNMAEGLGTFWNPHYTQTIGPVFHSHPPLAFGLEALAFRLLGDHWWVEKLYSMMTFLLAALLIALIWKRTTNNLRWAWLPLLLWICMPVVTWCAANNMLENTMTVFVLLSVYLLIISYQRDNKVWLFMSGISLFLAFLSKGFTGLFPLVFPLIYCVFDERRRWIQGPIDMLLLFVELAALSGLMFLVFPQSLPYLKEYIQVQVLGTGLQEATVATRFSIVFKLMGQVLISLMIVMVLLIVNKLISKKTVKTFEFPLDRKWFIIFLIFGLTGVLPIMLSVKQRDFYMLAAMPFFALAFGHLILSLVNAMLLEIKPKTRNWMIIVSSIILLVGMVLNVCHIGKYGRDEAFLVEMKKALKEIPENEIIEIRHEDFSQWSWHAYFMRYGKVCLDASRPHPYSFSYHPKS